MIINIDTYEFHIGFLALDRVKMKQLIIILIKYTFQRSLKWFNGVK